MSLKEKAKTLVEIIRKGCSYVYITRCKDCIGECEFEGTENFAGKWIRLEDAQQEIDRLKQKLKKLVDDFYSGYPVTQLFLSLQELLKEEKEAQPKEEKGAKI